MSGAADPSSVSLAPDALTLQWPDGPSSLAAAVLRANCRCAPCQSLRLRGETIEVDAGVSLVDAQAIGHYAVQLRFSDGHERGIYPWPYLRALGGAAAHSAGSLGWRADQQLARGSSMDSRTR